MWTENGIARTRPPTRLDARSATAAKVKGTRLSIPVAMVSTFKPKQRMGSPWYPHNFPSLELELSVPFLASIPSFSSSLPLITTTTLATLFGY